MEDSKIIELFFARSEQAIIELSKKYEMICKKIAKNILNNMLDAEECVNDTYMSAWKAMPPHKPSILSTFLGKITRNLSLNRYKYMTASKRGGGEAPAVFDEIAELVSETDSVEQEIDRRELVKAIDTFLDGLPTDKRSIFINRYWYFDSIPDIASRFGMTKSHVSVTLNRIRSELHKHLIERGFEL